MRMGRENKSNRWELEILEGWGAWGRGVSQEKTA